VQHFIKLSAAVHELSCSQKKNKKKTVHTNVENNTVVTSWAVTTAMQENV